MIAHDSAGPHASLIPPLLVFLPRFAPSPPSARLSAGPGLGRRGAIDDGGWWPYSRNASAALPGPLQHWPPGLMHTTQAVPLLRQLQELVSCSARRSDLT
jgi:hypothetical protein